MTKFREIIIKSIDLQNRSYLNIADETKNITALDIYLVPKEGGEHERYVVDNNGLISKQSGGGGKLLPLSDSDGVQDNVSPYVSVNIDKQNGIRFYQYDNYYGMNYQASNFYVTKNGVNLSYSQLNDGNFQRSGSFSVNPSGVLSFSVDKTNSQTYQTDQTTLMLDPENTTIKNIFYKSSIGLQKFLNFSFEGIKTDTLPNAEGDPTFTKQVVIKDDGTFGVKPAIAESGIQTLYPKVDIIDYTQDSTNYYLRVTVSNMTELGFAGNPYFKVSVGQASNEIEAVGMIASYGYSYVNTSSPIYIGGFHFTITIPKASNGHPWFWDDNIMMAVTWLGNDNLDIQGGVESPYKPRRIANDTKKIIDIKPKGGIPYSGTTQTNPITGELHFGTEASNARLLKGVAGSVFSSISLFPDARLQLSSYSNMDRTYILMDKDQVSLWGNGSGGNKIEVKTFSTVISAGANTIATFSSAGVNILGLPNALGDATFTRQLVQKEDGTIGYEAKPIASNIGERKPLLTSALRSGEVYYREINNQVYVTFVGGILPIAATGTVLFKIEDDWLIRLEGMYTLKKFLDDITGKWIECVFQVNYDSTYLQITNPTNANVDLIMYETFVFTLSKKDGSDV